VNEYVLNVYLEYKRETSKVNVQIDILNPGKLRLEREFQPIELIIILDNLLNNSFKARATRILLEWKAVGDGKVALHVVDNGAGIPDKNLDKIFEFRFTTTHGSGLGLYHVREVIKRLGGSITVNNKLPKGVEFVLTFGR
jgi:signal transduction histidine kinase